MCSRTYLERFFSKNFHDFARKKTANLQKIIKNISMQISNLTIGKKETLILGGPHGQEKESCC